MSKLALAVVGMTLCENDIVWGDIKKESNATGEIDYSRRDPNIESCLGGGRDDVG